MTNNKVLVVNNAGKLAAIIIKNNYHADGIEFFTPNDFSQQLAYMNRPAGYIVEPHFHNEVLREVNFTQEVLLIKSGKVQVDFYDENRRVFKNEVLEAGDIILLASGGHGFVMLEATEMVEIKQGPYAGDKDKTRFVPQEKE